MSPITKPFFELNPDNAIRSGAEMTMRTAGSCGRCGRSPPQALAGDGRAGRVAATTVFSPELERKSLFHRAQSLGRFAVAFKAYVLSNARINNKTVFIK